MQADVFDILGKVVGTIELDDRVFGIEPNRAVVHQAVVTQQANARQGTHDTRTRGEVSGGGKKPYRQKGTGHARQGSKRAPHFTGGGVVFGPHPRSYRKAMPKKMRRLALRSVLSSKVAENELTVLDAFALAEGKTKHLVNVLNTLKLTEKAVIVLGARDTNVWRAAKNLQSVHAVTAGGMNLLDVLGARHLVLTREAVGEITQNLTQGVREEVVPERGLVDAELFRKERFPSETFETLAYSHGGPVGANTLARGASSGRRKSASAAPVFEVERHASGEFVFRWPTPHSLIDLVPLLARQLQEYGESRFTLLVGVDEAMLGFEASAPLTYAEIQEAVRRRSDGGADNIGWVRLQLRDVTLYGEVGGEDPPLVGAFGRQWQTSDLLRLYRETNGAKAEPKWLEQAFHDALGATHPNGTAQPRTGRARAR